MRSNPIEVRDLPGHSTNLMSPQQRRRLLLRDVDVLLDGGANSGQYASWIRECGYGGRIISFEPASATFALLAEVVATDDSWHCRREALGAEDGQAQLHLTRTSLGSSVLRRTSLHAQMWPGDYDAGTETVPVRSLCSVWDELDCDGRCVYLKLDVEGAELAVLEGAAPVLDRITLLELELPLVPMHHGAATLEQMLGFLSSHGFAPLALEQNHRGDDSTGQMLMLDGIFRSCTTGRSQ